MRTLKLTTLILFLNLGSTSVHAETPDAVLGYWASEGSIIYVSATDGLLSARVFALKDPTYTEGEEFGPVGAARRDDLNPEPDKRTQPVLGLELLSDYSHTGKRWEGKIYDPESGNTYSSRMSVDRAGNLKMRGYIGVALLGRTAVFEPLSRCTGNMQVILRNSSVSADGCVVNPVEG